MTDKRDNALRTIDEMKCQICGKQAEMFWRDKLNGRSEEFYTNEKGQLVCEKCLGHKPKTLQQLNEERKPNLDFLT